MKFPKIISGGQTGVDRAVLDFAIENKLNYGGHCPKGRIAEDGIIHKKYKLSETDSDDYSSRTEKNIVISDAVLIIIKKGIFGDGTKLTKDLCVKFHKKNLIVDVADNIEQNIKLLGSFINDASVLNIAGNRESTSPGIYSCTKKLLNMIFNDAYLK